VVAPPSALTKGFFLEGLLLDMLILAPGRQLPASRADGSPPVATDAILAESNAR
jgi:hypothetical protein